MKHLAQLENCVMFHINASVLCRIGDRASFSTVQLKTMKLEEIIANDLIIDLATLKSDKDLVEQVQTRLTELELYSGDVDRLYGPRTETALTEFCIALHLSAMREHKFGKEFAEQLLQATPDKVSLPLNLSGSVGKGGLNQPDDVRQVKQRFVRLGYVWIRPNSNMDNDTIETIQLFQSIIKGVHRVGGDGRIDVNGITLKWLKSSNAPRWQVMPIQGDGFINIERKQTHDDHDFGTNWIAKTIVAAGKMYQADYRSAKPNAMPLAVNDISKPRGGDTTDHHGHETGLACDFALPHKDGNYGGITYHDNRFDRAAMKAMLKALWGQNLVNLIYFNDPTLIGEGLCKHAGGHGNHGHFQIKPPDLR
jgi:hypothetical protein